MQRCVPRCIVIGRDRHEIHAPFSVSQDGPACCYAFAEYPTPWRKARRPSILSSLCWNRTMPRCIVLSERALTVRFSLFDAHLRPKLRQLLSTGASTRARSGTRRNPLGSRQSSPVVLPAYTPAKVRDRNAPGMNRWSGATDSIGSGFLSTPPQIWHWERSMQEAGPGKSVARWFPPGAAACAVRLHHRPRSTRLCP